MLYFLPAKRFPTAIFVVKMNNIPRYIIIIVYRFHQFSKGNIQNNVIPDITGLFHSIIISRTFFQDLYFWEQKRDDYEMRLKPPIIPGGFKLELLDPADKTISVLTPDGGYVSKDPTQQSFTVSLPSEECRGCAVSDHSHHMLYFCPSIDRQPIWESLLLMLNAVSTLDQTHQTGSRVGTQAGIQSSKKALNVC